MLLQQLPGAPKEPHRDGPGDVRSVVRAWAIDDNPRAEYVFAYFTRRGDCTKLELSCGSEHESSVPRLVFLRKAIQLTQ
jgi:hypothetical protein